MPIGMCSLPLASMQNVKSMVHTALMGTGRARLARVSLRRQANAY